jgi:hypothetical protein
MADYGPEILYRTGHAVLSIPNHRPQPGFIATWRILSAADPAAARAELERYRVDWILLCPNSAERETFAPGERTGWNLYRALVAGQLPAWVRALPLPAEVAGRVHLFAVVPEPAAPTAEPAADPAVAGQPAPDPARF